MIILWKYIYKKINVPSSSTLDILFVNSPEPKETVVDLPSDLFHQKSPPFTAHSTQLKHLNDFGFLFVQIFAHVRGLNVLGYMLYVSTASSEQEMSKSCNKLLPKYAWLKSLQAFISSYISTFRTITSPSPYTPWTSPYSPWAVKLKHLGQGFCQGLLNEVL